MLFELENDVGGEAVHHQVLLLNFLLRSQNRDSLGRQFEGLVGLAYRPHSPLVWEQITAEGFRRQTTVERCDNILQSVLGRHGLLDFLRRSNTFRRETSGNGRRKTVRR